MVEDNKADRLQENPSAGQPSEEEMREQLEAELSRLKVEDVLAQMVVSLITLARRRSGLIPGIENEKDLDQLRVAIDAVRALMPLLENIGLVGIDTLKDALAELQLIYSRVAAADSTDESPSESGSDDSSQRGPGPAESSGRLWVPGSQ